jgi:hypothetical protein
MSEERRWRLCGWVGETEEPEKIYIYIAGEMGCVADERKKNYILPARWGAWPAREKKNYIMPAGEMGCVAGEGKNFT